ncbi:hypothetical protein P171DRAFT_486349 [Karstenula rhodostoma CBS 690.94]|uniref:Uncharacterized protein n=1 Tax=Karstenula rhodostoma CBS 690.94 TaxID=1392251 RepID=A0A9P4PGC7_9PLEO|nr:hypothetical protein P171DRAFT_486349 [Karstenula rhodostoma CBS 690.94]
MNRVQREWDDAGEDERVKVKEAWMEQLRNDPDWDTGVPTEDSPLWKRSESGMQKMVEELLDTTPRKQNSIDVHTITHDVVEQDSQSFDPASRVEVSAARTHGGGCHWRAVQRDDTRGLAKRNPNGPMFTDPQRLAILVLRKCCCLRHVDKPGRLLTNCLQLVPVREIFVIRRSTANTAAKKCCF